MSKNNVERVILPAGLDEQREAHRLTIADEVAKFMAMLGVNSFVSEFGTETGDEVLLVSIHAVRVTPEFANTISARRISPVEIVRQIGAEANRNQGGAAK